MRNIHRIVVCIIIIILLIWTLSCLYNFQTNIKKNHNYDNHFVIRNHTNNIAISNQENNTSIVHIAQNLADTLFTCKSHSSSIDLTSYINISSFRNNENITSFEIKALSGMQQHGFDPISGENIIIDWKQDIFLRENGHVREGTDKWSFCRQRYLTWGILHEFFEDKYDSLASFVKSQPNSDIKIWNSQSSGAIHQILSNLTGYTATEYFGTKAKPGALYKSYTGSCVRNENFLDPTFPNNEFDLIISSEVFEHIPNPYEAFRQVHRVLKPNGMHIFTVPFNILNINDTTHAFLDKNGKTVFIGKPIIHGDPLNFYVGVPVFQVYGQEIARNLCNMGFDVIVQDVYAPDIGVIGEGIIYFVTKKIHRNITAENIYSDSLVSKNYSCFYNECISFKKDIAVFKSETNEVFPYTIIKLPAKEAAYYLLLTDGKKHLVWDWDSFNGLGLRGLSVITVNEIEFNSIPTGFNCERL